MDISIHNKALLLKHLHKFMNKQDLPWVNLIWDTYYGSSAPTGRPVGSFWWKSIIKLLSIFKDMAHCTVGQGTLVFFWHDKWGPTSLKLQFPHLFSFAKDELLSIKEATDSITFQDLFHLPLSNLAFSQFHQARICLEQVNLRDNVDQWKYIWNSTIFSPSKSLQYSHQRGKCSPSF